MRRKLTLSLILAMALAIAALVAGCGGDDSDDSATADGGGASNGAAEAGGGSGQSGGGEGSDEPIATASLTKAQYVKQANAICTRSREQRYEELDAYREENPIEGEDGQDAYLTAVLPEIYAPSIDAMVSELRELGAPSGGKKDVERFIVAFEDWVDAVEQLDGEEPSPRILNGVGRAANLAGAYNLTQCTYG